MAIFLDEAQAAEPPDMESCALEDVAAASPVCERALERGMGIKLPF